MRNDVPSIDALTPKPASLANDSGAGSTRLRCPRRTIAWASGCSEYCSMPAARRSTSSSATPSCALMRMTTGRPAVTVPVLSRTTV